MVDLSTEYLGLFLKNPLFKEIDKDFIYQPE